jgi:hypothetical protein
MVHTCASEAVPISATGPAATSLSPGTMGPIASDLDIPQQPAPVNFFFFLSTLLGVLILDFNG